MLYRTGDHHVYRAVHLIQALAHGDCSLDIHRAALEHIRQRAAELLCGHRPLLPLAFECGAHGECFGKPDAGSFESKFGVPNRSVSVCVPNRLAIFHILRACCDISPVWRAQRAEKRLLVPPYTGKEEGTEERRQGCIGERVGV